MQVWNVLHAACWKCRSEKIAKNWPSGHQHTTLSGYIFATKAHIGNGKKLVKQQYLPNMSLQYGELRPTSGWDRFVSLGHPCKFQQVSRLGSVTARHSSIGHQPNLAALNRERHLYLAGRPLRWALAHISSILCISVTQKFSFGTSSLGWSQKKGRKTVVVVVVVCISVTDISLPASLIYAI